MGKRMNYTIENIADALRKVRNGDSVRKAAKIHGIPASTLRDKVRQKYSKSGPGKSTVLTADEERKICEWIIKMARAGFPVSTQKVKVCVANFLKKTNRSGVFKKGAPGRSWLQGFFKRHPTISRRIPSMLPKHRAAVSKPMIKSWFKEIGEYITNENLQEAMKDPTRIFNMDETAVRTIPTKEVVLAEVGVPYVHAKVGNSDKESYTALFAANAAGQLAPTLMLYPYKQRMPGEIWKHLPEGWAAGRTESGWMNRDTFFSYLKDVFYPWVVQQGITFPIILFVDGHRSHVSQNTTDFCEEKQMELISLPPNSTQITQPLDVSFFRPLKVHWNQSLVEWRINHAGAVLPKKDIAPLLKCATDEMDNLQNTLINGFRKCGLYPFDSDGIDYSSLLTDSSGSSHTPDPDDVNMQLDTSAQGEPTTLDTSKLLRGLEGYLSCQQKNAFVENEHSVSWLGPSEDTNLFLVWKQIKNGLKGPPTTEFSREAPDVNSLQGIYSD